MKEILIGVVASMFKALADFLSEMLGTVAPEVPDNFEAALEQMFDLAKKAHRASQGLSEQAHLSERGDLSSNEASQFSSQQASFHERQELLKAFIKALARQYPEPWAEFLKVSVERFERVAAGKSAGLEGQSSKAKSLHKYWAGFRDGLDQNISVAWMFAVGSDLLEKIERRERFQG